MRLYRAFRIAFAALLLLALAIASAARSGPECPLPADDTNAPTILDRRPGTTEFPTPAPIVLRPYGEDTYGAGVYGR